MAGDWIKMRLDLPDDPAVVRIAAAVGVNEDEVVGKLHRLWSWADRHTSDGHAPGITSEWVDRYLGRNGMADALIAVGWLEVTETGITLPKFDRHNGLSAKRRGEAAIRQRLSRADRDNGVTGEKRDSIPRPFIRFVYERDNYQCVFCGNQSSPVQEDSYKKTLSIDHLVPRTRGGRTIVPNLVTCCRLCNNEKNDRTPEEWDLIPKFLQEGVTYEGGQICDKRVTKALQKCDQRREEKRREDSNNPPTPLSGGSPKKLSVPFEEQFERFWSVFPRLRRQGKGAARRAWKAAVLKLDPESIVTAAREYAESPVGRGQFVKMPSTWLNQECWADDRAAWQRSDNGHTETREQRLARCKPKGAVNGELV